MLFNAEKFELLLSNVTAINDSMVCFLDSRQKKQHNEVQENTFLQVLHVQNKLDDLMQLVQSLNSAPHSQKEQIDVEDRHAKLARFKTLAVAMEDDKLSAVPWAGVSANRA